MQQDLVRMNVPVVVVQSEYEEFIKREHAKYIVESLPNGEFFFCRVSVTSLRCSRWNRLTPRYSSSRAKSTKRGKIAG